MKDAAGDVRAVREATGPTAKETIILGMSETRERVRERETVYLVPEPSHAIDGAPLASCVQRAKLPETEPPARTALPAPPDAAS